MGKWLITCHHPSALVRRTVRQDWEHDLSTRLLLVDPDIPVPVHHLHRKGATLSLFPCTPISPLGTVPASAAARPPIGNTLNQPSSRDTLRPQHLTSFLLLKYIIESCCMHPMMLSAPADQHPDPAGSIDDIRYWPAVEPRVGDGSTDGK